MVRRYFEFKLRGAYMTPPVSCSTSRNVIVLFSRVESSLLAGCQYGPIVLASLARATESYT